MFINYVKLFYRIFFPSPTCYVKWARYKPYLYVIISCSSTWRIKINLNNYAICKYNISTNTNNKAMAKKKIFFLISRHPRLLKEITASGCDKAVTEQDVMLPMLFADFRKSDVVAQSHVDENILVPFVSAMLNEIDPTQRNIQAVCYVPSDEMGKPIMDIISKIARFAPTRFVYLGHGMENANLSELCA